MKAMIFAAGLGTRLRPHTNDRPKALVKLGGKTLLHRTIEKLMGFGVKEVVVNVHHFPEKMIESVAEIAEKLIKESHRPSTIDYRLKKIHISDETDELLETGGGLLKAADFFKNNNEPLIIHNVDILTNLDVGKMLTFHQKNDALATLAIRNRDTSRKLAFNDKMELIGWKNLKTDATKGTNFTEKPHQLFAFSGIHIISPKIFDFTPKNLGTKFSIIDWYLQLCTTQKILGFTHNESLWMDLGTPERLKKAEDIVKSFG